MPKRAPRPRGHAENLLRFREPTARYRSLAWRSACPRRPWAWNPADTRKRFQPKPTKMVKQFTPTVRKVKEIVPTIVIPNAKKNPRQSSAFGVPILTITAP